MAFGKAERKHVSPADEIHCRKRQRWKLPCCFRSKANKAFGLPEEDRGGTGDGPVGGGIDWDPAVRGQQTGVYVEGRAEFRGRL